MKELIVNNYPKSSITEAIKTIKTNLRFSFTEKINSILITSSVVGEGKSFISANLATAFANSNEKVLLIDCDLRRGRLHKIFDMDYDDNYGLSNLLIDKDWKNKLYKYIRNTCIKNLDILPNGVLPPNPTVLLESSKMDEIMDVFKNKYDIIILDTPPVMGLTDTLILTRLVDTSLIVVKNKKTTMEQLEITKIALENVSANICGVILNRIEEKSNKYYTGYYK